MMLKKGPETEIMGICKYLLLKNSQNHFSRTYLLVVGWGTRLTSVAVPPGPPSSSLVWVAILRESQPTDEERKEVAEDSGIRHEVILDEDLLDKPGC